MDEEETPAHRKTRQFAWLRRTGTTAMALADSAGAAALAQAEQSPEPDRATRRPDPVKAFMTAASAVRQIIALELRVEAGARQPGDPAAARKPAAYRVPPPPDPRRPLLKHVLHDAVRNDPDRARRRRDIDSCIEEEIQADPDGAQLIAETLGAICTKLVIDVDLARVPDAFLDFDEPIKTLTRPKTREHPS